MKKYSKYIIFILLIIAILTMIVFKARSKYKIDNNSFHAQNSEMFYFESKILTVDNQNIKYTDWDGTGSYEIEFLLSNYEDELRYNQRETDYSINYTSTDNIDVKVFINNVETNAGKMIANKKSDDIVKIVVTPKETLSNIKLTVNAISSSPYSKTLSANFEIQEKSLNNYVCSILDEVGNDYAKLLIYTNEYTGKLRIKYKSQSVSPNYVSELQNNITINEADSYMDITVDSHTNYELDFIKSQTNTTTVLGEKNDIFVEIIQ